MNNVYARAAADVAREAGGAVSDLYSNPFRFDMKYGFIGCAPGLKGVLREVVRPE